MKFRLEDIQVEIIEHITTFLRLSDIASLRLTSRTMESKASQRPFTAFFKQKDVKLTVKTLREMVRATSPGWLGALLQRCTITGILTNATSTADEHRELVSLLAEAFNNLKRRSITDGLVSLRIRVVASIESTQGETRETIASRSWRTVWDVALQTFNIAVAALQKSQLPVSEHLDVFGSVRGCSLMCDAFLASAQKLLSVQNFRHLKKLTVSLSAPSKPTTEPQIGIAATKWGAQAQSGHSSIALHGIMRLAHVMPDLEDLDLHWYNVGEDTSSSSIQPAASQEISSGSTFTKLRACSLNGIHISENDLLLFLRSLHARIISITNVRLISGTWAHTLTYLTSSDSGVTSYHLDDICEGMNLVHFDVPGTSKFLYWGGNVGPSTLTRRAKQVNGAITYRFAPGRAFGSGKRVQWLKNKFEEFGPPSIRRYDFVELNPLIGTATFDESDGRLMA